MVLDLLHIALVVHSASVHAPVSRSQAGDDQPVVASDPQPVIPPDQEVAHTQHAALGARHMGPCDRVGHMVPGGHTLTQPGHEARKESLSTNLNLNNSVIKC